MLGKMFNMSERTTCSNMQQMINKCCVLLGKKLNRLTGALGIKLNSLVILFYSLFFIHFENSNHLDIFWRAS